MRRPELENLYVMRFAAPSVPVYSAHLQNAESVRVPLFGEGVKSCGTLLVRTSVRVKFIKKLL